MNETKTYFSWKLPLYQYSMCGECVFAVDDVLVSSVSITGVLISIFVSLQVESAMNRHFKVCIAWTNMNHWLWFTISVGATNNFRMFDDQQHFVVDFFQFINTCKWNLNVRKMVNPPLIDFLLHMRDVHECMSASACICTNMPEDK